MRFCSQRCQIDGTHNGSAHFHQGTIAAVATSDRFRCVVFPLLERPSPSAVDLVCQMVLTAKTHKVEDAPHLLHPVLDQSSCQCKARSGFQLLDGESQTSILLLQAVGLVDDDHTAGVSSVEWYWNSRQWHSFEIIGKLDAHLVGDQN